MRRFIKITWMIQWRIIFAFTLLQLLASDSFGGALTVGILMSVLTLVPVSIVSAILVLCRVDIATWPLIKLIFKRQNPFSIAPKSFRPVAKPRYEPGWYPDEASGRLRWWDGYRWTEQYSDAATLESLKTPYLGRQGFNPNGKPRIDNSFNKGRMTGFEPKLLEPVRYVRPLSMYGSPGQGLSSSDFSNESIKAGQKGEQNFAKALSLTQYGERSLLDQVTSLWSVALPAKDRPVPDENIETDIDCVICLGDAIILIDLKNYKSGDVTYEAFGDYIYTIDNSSSFIVGKPHRMSQNMQMATERFQQLFPGRVYAYVVLMPTDRGQGKVGNVYWPGAIPAVTLETMVQILTQLIATHGIVPTYTRSAVNTIASQLLKS